MTLPPVLITAAHHPTALNAARAIKGLNVDIYGLTSRHNAACARSRVWDGLFDFDNSTPERILDSLVSVSDRFAGLPVLIPTQDRLVEVIASNDSVLEEHFRYVLPEQKVVDLLLDKTNFHEWAKRRGYPVPESHIVRSFNQLRSLISESPYPVVIKPYQRTREWEAASPGNKVYRLESEEDLDNLTFNPCEVCSKLLVQQWIAGDDTDIHFCLIYSSRRDAPLETLTGRKLLQWPRLTGSTAVCVSTDNERVRDLSLELLSALDYVGLGSVEFKQSKRNGEYYITEPTVGRPNLQSYISVMAGTNLIELAYLDAVGERERWKRKQYRPSIWIEEKKLFSCWRNREALGDMGLDCVIKGVLSRKLVSGAYWSLSDPVPFMELLGGFIKRGGRILRESVGRACRRYLKRDT